jgi:adenylosuccinate lyase
MERLAADPAFAAVAGSLDGLLDPAAFVGRAPEQVDDFLAAEVRPLLDAHADAVADGSGDVRV